MKSIFSEFKKKLKNVFNAEMPVPRRRCLPFFERTDEKIMALKSERKSRPQPRIKMWYPAGARIYDIKITIGEQDRLKILEFIKAVRAEVYIKMHVKRAGNHFHFYKPLFFIQKGGTSSTEIDRSDEDRYWRELMDSDRSPEEIQEEILATRCQIHSHLGQCWWSLDDDKNSERFDNQDFIIAVVIRADGNILYYNCRLDLFQPKEEVIQALEKFGVYRPERITFTNLLIEVIDDRGLDFDPGKIRREAQNLANEKVKIIRREKGDEDDDGYDDGYPISDDDDYCD